MSFIAVGQLGHLILADQPNAVIEIAGRDLPRSLDQLPQRLEHPAIEQSDKERQKCGG